MAETINLKLPSEMTSLFDDLKEVRSKNFEPTSYTSIVMDAVKTFHKIKVKK